MLVEAVRSKPAPTYKAQRLPLAPQCFDALVSGRLMSSIRYKAPSLSAGLLYFYADDGSERVRMVQLLRCTKLPLLKAAHYLDKADEWSDEFVLASMQAVYPEISLNDAVHVLEFEVL